MGPPSTTSVAPALRNRWVVRHIWRAFPELDTYSDDECRTFVRAVRRERILTAIRALLLAAAPISAVVGSVIIAALVYEWLEAYSLSESVLGSTVQLTAVGLSMAVVGLLSAFICLVIRDWLLRRRLRAVFDVGGHCRGCGYSFIGLMIPESLRIRCPECGMECTVDGSLTLLSRGPDGSAVGARRVVVKTHPPFWTRERIRWWLRTGAIATAIVLTPILIGLGVLEYATRRQVALAEADTPTLAEFTAVVKAAHPGATLTKEPQFMGTYQRAYGELLDLSPRSEQSEARQALLPSWSYPNFMTIVPDYDSTMEEDDGETDIAERVAELAAVAAWARTIMERAEAAGSYAQLKAAVDALPYEVRDAQVGTEQLTSLRLDYLGPARYLCSWLCARARLALLQNDTARAEESLKLALSLADRAAEQPFLIEGLVAYYCKTQVYATVQRWLMAEPTAHELDVIEDIMRDPGPRGDRLLHVDFEALWCRGLLADIYSDPNTIRRLLITGDLDLSARPSWGLSVVKNAGSWEDNRTALMQGIRDWRTDAAGPPSAAPAGTQAPVASVPVGFAQRFFSAFTRKPAFMPHGEVSAKSTIAAMVALERWRIRHGQYPDTLDALVPEILPAVPMDPWSAHPMGYRRMDSSADRMHLPYLLYSHGRGGSPGEGPAYDPTVPLSQRSEAVPMGHANYHLNLHLPLPRGRAAKPAPDPKP